MDFIQRLALLFLLSIPAFLPNTAHADYPSEAVYRTLSTPAFEDSTAYGSLDKFVAYYTTCSGSTGNRISGVISKLEMQYRVNWVTCFNGSQYGTAYIDTSKMDKCGTTYEPYNGVCTGSPPPPTCTPPLVLDAGSNTCKDPCDPKKWKDASYFTQGKSWPYTCFESCQVEGTTGDCGFSAAGVEGCYYQGRFTGVSCTGTEAGTGQTPPVLGDTPEYDCIKDGKTWGTVNGTTVCVSKGTAGSSPTTSTTAGQKTTTKNADGTTTVTQEPSKVVSMGSGSGGGTKVTEETKNADGTTTTKESDAATYCQNNPTAEVCKQMDKGSFSGSCVDGVATVQCNGDAAQCAIAQESANLNCSLSKDDPVLTGKFNEAKNDNGATNPATAANISTVHLPTALDASSPYSGQCIQDVTINVASSSVSIPFSAWCPYLEAIGYLFLACAYISAAFILGSAI